MRKPLHQPPGPLRKLLPLQVNKLRDPPRVSTQQLGILHRPTPRRRSHRRSGAPRNARLRIPSGYLTRKQHRAAVVMVSMACFLGQQPCAVSVMLWMRVIAISRSTLRRKTLRLCISAVGSSDWIGEAFSVRQLRPVSLGKRS
eukprot:symbB.v1.2.040248.t1/scaffold7099.1/size13327/3